MPEHDETDAPEDEDLGLTDEEIMELHHEEMRKRGLKPKAERWKVENKADEAETK